MAPAKAAPLTDPPSKTSPRMGDNGENEDENEDEDDIYL